MNTQLPCLFRDFDLAAYNAEYDRRVSVLVEDGMSRPDAQVIVDDELLEESASLVRMAEEAAIFSVWELTE